MDRRKSRQAIGLPHGRQQGRVRGVLERGLGAEEQQIEQQTLGYIGLALGQRAVLRQYLRRNPLDMQIYLHQFQAHRIHKGCGDLPKHARTCRRLACRQAGKNFRKCLRGAFVACANQRKQRRIDPALGINAIGQRLSRRPAPGIEPAPAVRPQIGWMGAFRTGQLLHLGVLRKQSHCGGTAPGDDRLQILHQRKASTLDLVG